jgi:hypothetical protein
VKNDRIGRSVIMSADDLKAKAIGALGRLQKLPGIVRGFLRDPKLAYILELHSGTACGVYKLIFSLVSRRDRRESLVIGSLQTPRCVLRGAHRDAPPAQRPRRASVPVLSSLITT